MIKRFIDSYQKVMPASHRTCLTTLTSHPNLFVNYPVAAASSKSFGVELRAEEKIPVKSNIIMLSTSQSFTNMEFIGASQSESNSILTLFQDMKKESEMLQSDEIKSLFSILMQVYANQVNLDSGMMPLHQYAQSLMSEKGWEFDFDKYAPHIKSVHLKSILQANKGMTSKLYSILTNFIKTSNEEEFANILKVVRSQIRRITPDHENALNVDFLAPIFPSVTLSYNPNCAIIGKYFTHLRQSYYCLQATKPIQAGDILTLPYRKGISNYDKMVRYGPQSIERSNPDNNFMLIVNLPSEKQVLEGNIDKKTSLLKEQDLKMKNFIKIDSQGQILKQDMKMLRILYNAKGQEQDSNIFKMVGKYAQSNLSLLRQAQTPSSPSDPTIEAIRIIEEQEIAILQKLVDKR